MTQTHDLPRTVHDAAPYGYAAPPAPPRWRRGGSALLLVACLGAGATGAGLTTLLQEDTTAAPTSTGGLTRAAALPASTAAGTPESAAAVISPSVVTIAVTGTAGGTGRSGSAAAQPVSGTGSGIVLSADGYVVTNNHVVSAAVAGGTVSVTFSDGRTSRATIVGTDPSSDLAVLRVSDRDDLVPAVLADSDELAVGQTVLAVGAPLGLSDTVTQGIVSTLDRPVRTGEAAGEQSVIDAVQTDAAINPGNSGGALVDLAGSVVGVNTAIASTTDTSTGATAGSIGVGFAIPANDVSEVVEELIADGTASHPVIGISVGDATSTATGTPGLGATVQAVTSGGPAAQAGLEAGDVLTEVGDRAVTDADSLIVAVRSYDPGDAVTLTYVRDGETRTAEATLVAAQQD